MPTLAPILDVEAAATLLRCAASTVRAECRSGNLPGLKLGEDWILPTEALLQRLNALATAAATERRTPAPTPTAVLHAVQGGKARRPPPALPDA